MEIYEPTNLNLWTHPDNYAGEVWPGYYSAGVGRSRDSDCLEESNFECMIAALREADNGDELHDDWQIVREGHWAVGWVEWIAISQDSADHLRVADQIVAGLQDYPVIDDMDYCERESEEANRV